MMMKLARRLAARTLVDWAEMITATATITRACVVARAKATASRWSEGHQCSLKPSRRM